MSDEVRPVTQQRLVTELVEHVLALGRERRFGIAIDGAPSTGADAVAASLIEPLRSHGRFALHVPASGFLRAASLRFEQGRTNPDAYYEDWLDLPAIHREVLGPLAPGGSGRVLPSLWDPVSDRATRASYVDVPPAGIVVLSGALLLGTGLPLDFTVHLEQTPATLARRVEAALSWTVPALNRYTEEVMPHLLADVTVRVDDPRRPAIVRHCGLA